MEQTSSTPTQTQQTHLEALGMPAAVATAVLNYVAALNTADEIGVRAENRRREAQGEAPLPWSRYAQFNVDETARPGGRYIRVVSRILDGPPGGVHAFVEKATGDVLKPDGWRRPAKGVRLRLLADDAPARVRELSQRPSTIHGGYLYATR